MTDAPLEVTDDGLWTPDIKAHSLEKIRLHNRYAGIFTRAMAGKWPQLAYIGLYSGSGRARLAGTNRIFETSALAVVRQPVPFTDYIFVDNDPDCVRALPQRIRAINSSTKFTIVHSDVNESADVVRRALPSYSREKGLLSFCFVDPFDLQLRFDTIRRLSYLRVDLLILLMLGVDARRNLHRYLNDENSNRIGDLIASPDWRSEFAASDRKIIHFIVRKFDQAMQGLGYLSAADDLHEIKVVGMGVFQYALAFYSKSDLAKHFWRESRSSLNPQLGLGL